MSAALAVPRAERSVRRLLHAYPPVWRRSHGEALTGCLLDLVDAREGDGLTLAEKVDVVRRGLAVRLRLLAPSPSTRAAAGTLALVTGTALAATTFVLGEWVPWRPAEGLRADPGHVGPFATLAVVLCMLWLAAFGAAVSGRDRVARAALVVTLVATLALSGARILSVVGALLGVGVGGGIGGGGGPAAVPVNLPPGVLVLMLLPLTLLAWWGVGRWSSRHALRATVAAAGLTVLMVAVATRGARSGARAWSLDPSYAFYRGGGVVDLWIATGVALPTILVGALVVRRWRPHWGPAVLLLAACFALVAPLPESFAAVAFRLWATVDAQPWSGLYETAAWLTVLLLAVAVVVRWSRGPLTPA